MSLTGHLQEQPCPGCGRMVDTTGLEPFAKVTCPDCGFQLRVERVFENYVVIEPLGAGGMGSVYKARDTRLNRFVALKLLRQEFAGDESFTAKLEEEARITASIHHPHVVEVYSVGRDHGQVYVVMELVDGGSLDDRIEDEKRIPELQMLEIGLQVARGLRAALEAGLIHRDIKPGNILFAEKHQARIVDFGLALLAEQHAGGEGEIWGTPYYVAPERLTNEREDFRSDIYSLGATLFHAVAGRPTFEQETQSATELKKLKENPVGLEQVAPDVSEQTAAVINRMLRPNPAERQSSYKELIGELQSAHAALLAREEELRQRWSWRKRLLVSLGAAAGLLALAGGALFVVRHLPPRSSGAGRTPPPEAPVAQNTAQRDAARHELEAGHYAAAEALFREIASTEPGVQPVAELCAALQLWERGDFAQAATGFQHFVRQPRASPSGTPRIDWINRYRPLAQNRLDDYQLYNTWEKTRAPNDPEKSLKQLREILPKLKTKGALSFRLTDEEAKLAAEVAELTAKRARDEQQLVTTETPRWAQANARAHEAIAALQFNEAVAILQSAQLRAASLRAQQDDALQRARWLVDWKQKLIGDINQIGFGGAVTDIHGVRYDGPIRRATATEIELKTRYGPVMSKWLNLSPQMLLTMSRAFIRPGVPDIAEREWLCAIFARETGQRAAADELATKAAETKPEFRDLRERFFFTNKRSR